MLLASVNSWIDENTSDGFHTFAELYEHRQALWIAFCRLACRTMSHKSWRSDRQTDGNEYDGFFLLGIGRDPGEQLSYHLPNSLWDSCDFAETLAVAPPWDGHTGHDVIERLGKL
jgi:hypothetical protein